MKIERFYIIFFVFAALAMKSVPIALAQPVSEDEKKIIQYQIEVATQTADHIQEIFDKFNESFIDYEPALKQINILINEYNKAIQYLPSPLPKEGKKLDKLVRQLLAKVEKYFVYYKRAGRENPYIIAEIHEALARVSYETERLSYTQ